MKLVSLNKFELLENIKSVKSFDGLKLLQNSDCTLSLNVIPIKLEYQLEDEIENEEATITTGYVQVEEYIAQIESHLEELTK